MLLNGNCEPLITPTQAGNILGVSAVQVKRLAAKGEIPFVPIGKLYKFRASVLDAWIRRKLESKRHP